MNAYRAVITGTVFLALLSTITFAVLSDQGATYAAAVELVILLVADVFASAYVLLLTLRDRRRPRSWLLMFLATSKIIITVGLYVIAFVILRRLVGWDALPNGVGVRLIGVGLNLIAYVPLMTAVLFWLVQRDPTADGTRESR